MTWPKRQVIHRIHPDPFAGNEFNPGIKGNARFSPMKDEAGKLVPTLYGGTTFDCAAMETVFHDVPFAPGLKTEDKGKLTDKVYSTLVPHRDITLVDLSSTALKRLGIRRDQLIDTEKNQYPGTRAWSEALHASCPDADGLCWISRQDDRAQALMLFGDRVSPTDLVPTSAPLGVVSHAGTYLDLLALADRIGVQIVAAR